LMIVKTDGGRLVIRRNSMTVDATGQHRSNQGPFVSDADSAHVLSVEKSCPDRSGILAESGQENLR